MDVAEILLSAQSAVQSVRQQAESVLASACESDFAGFATTLATHLASEAADAESRRLAGLILKNNVDSKDRNVRATYHARWMQLDNAQLRPGIRACLMQALSSPAPQPRRAAAQVIAKIAAIELPVPGTWDSLVTDLLSSSTAESSPDHLRQAALETLGYICEDAGYGEISAQVLTSYSNQILTAVVHGMTYNGDVPATDLSSSSTTEDVDKKNASAADVRFTATVALNNALEFARTQFEVDNERMAIMNTVYNAAKSTDVRIRHAAFECLVKIGEHYYDKLPEYIRWLFELTENAIRSDEEQVALQGIEFWNTICDEEIALIEEAEASRELGTTPERVSKSFVVTALPYLIQPILACLKQQEEDALEDDVYNRATAAAVCLELLAQAAPNQILQLVMPFVESNIVDAENWRSREAAVLAFGSVLDGPPTSDLKALVNNGNALSIIMGALLNDPHVAVRDSAAWTLARVVQIDREMTAANLPALVECLRGALSKNDSPVVAGNVCFAIHNLAECFLDEANEETGALRDHAEILLRGLLFATSRSDGAEGQLRTNAYEALGMMLRAVPKNCIIFVQSCLPMLLEKLETSLMQMKSDISEDDVLELIEVQGLLCGTMVVATERLAHTPGLEQFADRMMGAYLQLLTVNRSGAHEEALCAIAAFAQASGSQFQKYMQHLMGPLSAFLSNHEQYQTCRVAISVVVELCNSLGQQMMLHADNIVYLLLEALQSTTLDKTVKPPILSCFGDIAFAVQEQFEKYLPQVMTRLQQAAKSSVQMEVGQDDYDMQDWIISLREAIFEAYTGIVNGMQAGNKQELLFPFVEWFLQFCEVVVGSETSSALIGDGTVVKGAVAALCDLIVALPSIKNELRQRQWMAPFLERGSHAKDAATREMACLAQQSIYATS